MRVVFFVHRYWPAVGGVEKYVHELAKALRARGIDIDVVAGTTGDESAAPASHDGVPIHRFPAHRSRLRTNLWLRRHANLFDRADVIHVSNTHMLEHLWRVFGTRLDRRRVFLTRHGLSYIHPVPDWERRRAVRSLGLASGFVHDGQFIEKWLGVPADLCPDQGLSPRADDLPWIPEPPPESAVYIGRLEPDSGIRVYLDAVRLLNKAMRFRFGFEVFGDGSLLDAVRREAARDGLPIRFHGRVANAQDRIPRACFAFLDGRMAMQEAMARRRLVCAAYVDPLKRDYICGEPFSPFLLAAGNAEELAAHVAHFARHPAERVDMVERAYAFARSLGWDRTANAYEGLWRSRLRGAESQLLEQVSPDVVAELRREIALPKAEWAREWPVTPTVAATAEVGAG